MSSTAVMDENLSSLTSSQPCCRFSLAEIQSATNDFDDEWIVGHGGFGKVYKGCICTEETCRMVAVKRLDSMSNQGAPEFRAEIEMLSRLRHCNLVSLIGYCDDNKEMILVYEYMPNGTLYDHIHKVNSRLSWVQRLNIAIGAARGLDYLHTGVGTKHGIIHRDVKSSNILLDENWSAMISDFGLSKIGPTNQTSSYVDASIKGTFGYMDPEYFYTRKLTRKTDVFAFGVVLFELISGRLPVDIKYGEEDCSLVRWAQRCVNERKFEQMVDSGITGTVPPKCLRQFAQIAYRCLISVPKERPAMTEVVAPLQALLELQKKCGTPTKSTGIMSFTWNIHKYLVSTTKQSSDQSGTSSPTTVTNNMNQHKELAARDVKKFTYLDLKCATRNFGNNICLGNRSYGNVYKGWVHEMTYFPHKHNVGLPIAIEKIPDYKRFDVGMLKEFSHPNLVKLIGYCLEGDQLFVVNEYMHKRNLEDVLYSGAMAQLPLATKVKLVVGIARGIVFLHSQIGRASDSRFYRHKILLKEDFTAKLSYYDVAMLLPDYHTVFDDYDYDESEFGNYYPGFQPFQLRINLSGFKVVFAEVLTGEKISILNELWKINRFFSESGIESLDAMAQLCFEKCNEVDSESKMLKMLEEYDDLIRSRLKTWLRTRVAQRER